MEKRKKQLAILGLTGTVLVSSLGGCADPGVFADEEGNSEIVSFEGEENNLPTEDDVTDPSDDTPESNPTEPSGTPENEEVTEGSLNEGTNETINNEETNPEEGNENEETIIDSEDIESQAGSGSYSTNINGAISQDRVFYSEDGVVTITLSSGFVDECIVSNSVPYSYESSNSISINVADMPNFGITSVFLMSLTTGESYSVTFEKFVGTPSEGPTLAASGNTYQNNGITYYTGDIGINWDGVSDFIKGYVAQSQVVKGNFENYHCAVTFANGESAEYGTSRFIKDTSAPELVSITGNTGEVTLDNGKYYITKDGTIDLRLLDTDSGIASVVIAEGYNAVWNPGEGVLTVDTSNLPNLQGLSDFVIVTDNVGNSVSFGSKLYKATGLSSLNYACTGVQGNTHQSEDGNIYYNGDIVLQPNAITCSTAVPSELITGVSVIKDNNMYAPLSEAVNLEEGTFSVIVSFVGGASVEVPVGTFVLDETACDIVSNYGGVTLSQGTNGVSYLSTDGVVTHTVTDGNSGVRSVTVSGIPDSAFSIENGVVSVFTENLGNLSEYNYTVTALDNLGNKTEESYTLNKLVGVDAFDHAIVMEGDMVENNGIAYYNTELCLVRDHFLSNDYEISAIEKVEVLKDGAVVTELNSGDTCTILGGTGEYSVKFTYVTGEEHTEIVKRVEWDNSCEGTQEQNFTGSRVIGANNIEYVTEDGAITYLAEDTGSGIQSVVLEGLPEGSYTITDSLVVVDTSKLINKSIHTYSITVTDNLGNTSTDSYTLNKLVGVASFVHNKTFTGDFYEKDSVKYYNNGLTVKLSDTITNSFELDSIASIELIDREGIVVGDLKNLGEVSINSVSSSYTLKTTYVTGSVLVEDFGSVIFDNSVDSIIESAVLAETKTGVDGERYIIKDGTIEYTVEDIQSGINLIEVSGLPQNSFTINEGIVSVNTASLDRNGVYFVKVKATDNVGNSLEETFTIKMLRDGDLTSATANTVSSQGVSYGKDGKSYIKYAFTFEMEDYDSRISKVELLKDGDFYQDITQGTGSIDDTGFYSLRVTTILGIEDVPLTLLDGVSSSFVKDTEFDSISYDGNTCTEVTGSDDTVYITKDGVLNFTLVDSLSGIDYVEILDIYSNPVEFSLTDGSLTIDTAQFNDGHIKLSIIGRDNVGNSSLFVHEIDILREVPEIVGLNHSSIVNIDGESYSKSLLTLNISGHTHSKMRYIQIYNNGAYIRDFEGGLGTIDVNGTYSIRTEDVAGNVKWYDVSDLFSNLSNNIVVDMVSPESVATVNGKPIAATWLTEDSVLGFRFEDNEALLKGSVKVNDQVYQYSMDDGAKGFVGSIDLKNAVVRADDGLYRVVITVQDRAGNVYTSDEEVVYYDYTAPTVQVSVSGQYTEDEDGYLYVNGSLIVSDSGCQDIGSGVKSIEVLRDGTAIEGMTISEDGTYSVRVTDNAGLSTEVDLAEFIDGVSTSKIRIDTVNPQSSRESGFDYELEKDGYIWYSKYPVLTYKITDTYMKFVSIKVNGDERVSELSQDGIYEISTEGYAGLITVDVLAKDKYGHEVTDRYVYKTDLSAPTVLGASLAGDYTERDGVLFFKSNPSVLVSAEDTETGIKQFNLAGSRDEVNETGAFELGTGEYTVEVVDYIGNTTGGLSIKDLCGLSSNKFIVDGEAPVITTERPAGDVNGWYSKDVEYTVKLEDNQGIKSAKVIINGTVVTDYTSPDIYTTLANIVGTTANATADSQGGYQVRVEVTDNAGNTDSWEDYIKIDRTAPVVEFFEFTGDGYQEGSKIGGSEVYGFYFTGDSSVRVKVSDGEISSGMKNLYVTLRTSTGAETKLVAEIKGGYATFSLPVNFKGFISAYADDMVFNNSEVARPDGVISEDANYFVNNLKLNIELQGTEFTDLNGYPLYNKDSTATATIGCTWSGIRTITWGTSEGQQGTVTVNNDGSVSGDSVNVVSKDHNLVVDLTQSLSLIGNKNDITVWVEVVDRVGRTSKTSKQFSIDKDAPVLQVTWNNTESDRYYNQDRIATIHVQERNFDPEKVTLTGKYGKSSGWSNNGESSWVCTLTFNEDDVYAFSVYCVDRAGLQSETYTSEGFTVDKTKPTISVSWDNNSYKNGKYYDKGRKATITVVEHNFNPSLFSLEGTGTLGNWSSGAGDTHTAVVSFMDDGEYAFTIRGKDLADNEIVAYESGAFTIDTQAPTLEILGVENNISYKKDVRLEVNIADSYIDSSESYVSLTGKRHGEMRLEGDFTAKTGRFVFEEFPMEAEWDDIYTVKVHVVDMSGNITEDEVTFSVNRFGSSYEFLDAGMLDSYIKEPKDIVIRETNVDRLEVSKARIVVILNGEEITVDSRYLSIEETEGNDGKFNYIYSVDKNAFTKDGKYLIQIYSVSYDGTENSSLAQEYAFILDTTAPEVVVSGIKTGGVYHEYNQYVTFDIREAIGVKTLTVMLNGAEVPLTEENGIYSLVIQEGDSRQNLVIAVEDLAGNKTVVEVSDFFITSSMFSYLMNQWWFKATIGGVVSVITLLLLLLLKRRRDSRKEEEKMLKDNVELYKSSTLSSSSLGSANTKDEVEDLDKE